MIEYIEVTKYLNNFNTGNTCSICLSNKVDKYYVPCGHTCCKKCAERSLSLSNSFATTLIIVNFVELQYIIIYIIISIFLKIIYFFYIYYIIKDNGDILFSIDNSCLSMDDKFL